ncbi:hypothetical protein JAAARDRAFT_488290 [Jaapia argillacea MUCL 33604]|uniref:Uncharacterized protein n=1 Tax=Jaapia argillacea MUCL 33604 TaxID=933084 RepID=A0A067PBL5_9AGAM|nr:hypothetical protein JAAARDRAFT_488290 [Jaapia argillacea MUCL 33604]
MVVDGYGEFGDCLATRLEASALRTVQYTLVSKSTRRFDTNSLRRAPHPHMVHNRRSYLRSIAEASRWRGWDALAEGGRLWRIRVVFDLHSLGERLLGWNIVTCPPGWSKMYSIRSMKWLGQECWNICHAGYGVFAHEPACITPRLPTQCTRLIPNQMTHTRSRFPASNLDVQPLTRRRLRTVSPSRTTTLAPHFRSRSVCYRSTPFASIHVSHRPLNISLRSSTTDPLLNYLPSS